MPHYTGTVESPRPVEDVFADMADFSHTAEWDPSIQVAEKLTPGEVREGTEFRIVVEAAGSETEIHYTVQALRAPDFIEVRGENDHLVSVDRVTVERTGAGSKVTYDAELELKGARKLAHPLVSIGFERNSEKARTGLEERLT